MKFYGFLYPTTARILFLIVILLTHSSCLFASKNQSGTDQDLLASLLKLEVEGVSLSMPLAEIQTKLQAVGYAQVSHTTFIKEVSLGGGRQSIYRIEIEYTPSADKLGYFRSESGGRNKSPVTQLQLIPEQEAGWANRLYALVCSQVSDENKLLRACEPVSEATIRFGQVICSRCLLLLLHN